MAQKVVGYIKLQIPAGKATPAPPVGPALGQHGVNIMAFTKEFNERTKKDVGMVIPVVITFYADRSFSFITKTPPAAVPIKKAINLETASGEPNKKKVGKITRKQLEEIANIKMPEDAAVYTLTLTIHSPAENQYLLHVDAETGVEGRFWDEPLVVTFENWEYSPLEY